MHQYLRSTQRLIVLVSLLIFSNNSGAQKQSPKPFIENFEVLANIAFEIADERPFNEKTSSQGSFNQQSCDFGIWRIGDEEVLPSRLDYLKTRLQREVSLEKLRGKTIRIREYSIFFNQQLSARSSLSSIQFAQEHNKSLQNSLSPLLQSFECWAGPEMPGGYEFSSNLEKQPVGVVSIRLDLGSTEFKSRYSFAPNKHEQNLPVAGTALIRAVDGLVHTINEAR